MLKQKLICDGCGKEIPLEQNAEKGGFVIFRKKMVAKGGNIQRIMEREGYDLCIDCAQKVEDFIKKIKKRT